LLPIGTARLEQASFLGDHRSVNLAHRVRDALAFAGQQKTNRAAPVAALCKLDRFIEPHHAGPQQGRQYVQTVLLAWIVGGQSLHLGHAPPHRFDSQSILLQIGGFPGQQEVALTHLGSLGALHAVVERRDDLIGMVDQ